MLTIKKAFDRKAIKTSKALTRAECNYRFDKDGFFRRQRAPTEEVPYSKIYV